MKRLSYEEEMSLMLPSSNMRNMKNFSEILPHFYYDLRTNDRILKNLNALTRSFPDNFLDKRLDLNSQFRAFYQLETNEENDPAYLTYARFLFDNCLHIKSWYAAFQICGGLHEDYKEDLRQPNPREKVLFEKLEMAEKYNIMDYDTFIKGKVVVGKDERKLFRFCLQNELLSNEQVDELNTLKTKGGLYICMSRNPVDYLFVSTHQSFTSCLNLESEAEGCFWMGLGGLVIDASRFLTFVTSGRLLKYIIKGFEFKHFKYDSRSWGLAGAHEELCIVNTYPADKIGMRERLREVGYKIIQNSSSFTQSLINHEIPRHQDGSESTIYLDNIGISCRNRDKRRNKRTWYYTEDGTTGSLSEFDFEGTFEAVSSFEDLTHDMKACSCCGERFHEENGFYCDDGGCICSYCYDEYYFTCRECRNVHHNDYANDHDGMTFCNYCFDSKIQTCAGCGKTEFNRNIYRVDNKGWCTSCYEERYFECVLCTEYKPHEERGPGDYDGYCIWCYNKTFTECTTCGCIEEHRALTKYDGDKLLCFGCVEEMNAEEGK